LQWSPSALSRVSFTGSGSLPSAFRVTDLAVGSVGAAALAISELVGTCEDRAAPRVVVDRRLASLWFGSSIVPVGWALPAPWDAIAGDYPTVDGWIRLHTNAPHHRAAALRALACADDRVSVAAAVARWRADELEAAVLAADGCAAAMRSVAGWDAHPQGIAVAAEPSIDIASTVPTDAVAWQPCQPRPLGGLKVLDLTRVLAGPVATRFLAGYGADVLRIDPPDWDEPGVVPDVTLGKRCARLDLTGAEDRKTFERLLAEADVLVHGYRPGALDGLGYDAPQRRVLNPALIDVSLDAYGWTGPWHDRRGFDSLVQMSSGIAAAGMAWKHADRPTPLPVQALDHATGYLVAAAVVSGVTRRLADRQATTARLSLARVARLLVDAGRQDDAPNWSACSEDDLSPVLEDTDWGLAKRVVAPVAVEGVPMSWCRGAARLGSSIPRWDL
jgi:crotonobetainyl-CoA:carnitine CoA-transferase CaiB-like acyl-CoA transferase